MSSTILKRLIVIILFINIFKVFAQNTQQYPDFVRGWQQTEALINPGAFTLDSSYASVYALQKIRTGPLKKIGFKTALAELKAIKNQGVHSFRVILYSETEGPFISRPRWYGNYAYQMRLSNDFNVGLGVAYGYVQNRFEAPTALNGNNTVSDGAIGLKVKYKELEFGASVLQLFNNAILTGSEVSLELTQYASFTTLYAINLTEKYRLVPAVNYRYLPEGKDDVLLTLEMVYNQYYAFGIIQEISKGVSFYLKSTRLFKDLPLSFLFLYKTPLFANTPNSFNNYEIGVGYSLNR